MEVRSDVGGVDLEAQWRAAREVLDGDNPPAARPLLEAIRLASQRAERVDSEADALVALAELERRERRPDRAVTLFEAARGLRDISGDTAGAADALLSLGDCQRALSRWRAATDAYQAAAALVADSEDRVAQAHAAFKLGELLATRAPEQAAEAFTRASELYAQATRPRTPARSASATRTSPTAASTAGRSSGGS
jgi:tetratricopeptide (TPR) repeat protein